MLRAYDAGIRKTGDASYEIKRDLVDKLLSSPSRWLGRGARVVPAVRNGKHVGFKLYAIRPSSLYARVGLRNGDTIEKIDGVTISGPHVALSIYSKLKTASKIVVEVVHRGKPHTLTYTIVPAGSR